MVAIRDQHKNHNRRAVSFALTAISIVMLLGMASLTVDVGMLYRARSEAQASADAAAMAGAWKLLDNDKLKGTANMTAVISAARTAAIEMAARNKIINTSPSLSASISNNANGDGDIIVGYLSDPDNNPSEPLSTADPGLFNTVRVRVRRDAQHSSPIDLYFAGVFGRLTADISAEAYATFKDGVVGYKVDDTTGNADLLPLALKVTAWDNLLSGAFTSGDNYTYNAATGAVTAGPDGIKELNLYPGGASQLPPGNFGSVDIGNPNNSTADLSRQIRDGVSEDDLAYFGGELVLGPDGTVALNGDTGLSAAIKDDLTSIIGKPRAILLYSSVTGPGNNSVFTIVGFVGIRILDVQLTGSKSSKHVIIQPAFVVDDAAMTGPGSGSSNFVYAPVHLVR